MGQTIEFLLRLKDDMSSTLDGVQAKLSSFGSSALTAGKALTAGLTVPLVALGTAAITAALQVDDALDGIRTTTGATGEALAALEGSFKSVAATVPVSLQQSADAVGQVYQATGLTGAALEALSTQLLNVSRITGSDLSTTVSGASRLFGDWSITTQQQAGSLDFLFRTSQATGIEFDALTQKLVQFGAPLRQMGFSFEESAVLMGKWEKEGVNSELVLGSLRIAIGNFAEANIPLREGLDATIAKIRELGPGAEATSIAMQTFGSRAGPDMAAAILEGRFQIDELMATLRNSPETINKAAGATDGFKEKLSLLKNQATLALEPVGTRMLEVLEKLMPALTIVAGWIATLAEKFGNLGPTAQIVVLGFLALAAALGPVLATLSAIVPWFAAGTTGATLLGGALTILTGPIGLVIAAVAALWLAWSQWGDDITALVKRVYESVKAWLVDAWEGSIFQSIAQMLKAIIELWVALHAKILEIAMKIGGVVVLWLVDKLKPVFDFLKPFFDTIAAGWGLAKAVIETIVSGLYTAVKTWLLDKFTAIVDGIKGKIDAVTGFFKNMKDAVVGNSFVPDMVMLIGIEFAKLETVMVAPVRKAASEVLQIFSDLLEGAVGAFSQGGLKGLGTFALETARTFATDFASEVGRILGPKVQQALAMGANLSSAVGGALGGSTGANIAGIASGLGGAAIAATSWGTAMAAAGVAGSIALAGATFGIGLAAVGIYKLFTYTTEYEKRVREAAKQTAELRRQAIEIYGSAQNMGLAFSFVGIQIEEAFKSRDPRWIKTVLEEGAARIRAFNTGLMELAMNATGAGRTLDESFRPYIEQARTAGILTDDLAGKLLGMTTDNSASWQEMQGLAEKYGVELGALGPTFQQQKLTATASEIISAFDRLIGNGADYNGVLQGMTDEINVVVQESLKFGTQIPENMRPWIASLIASGDLLGLNKTKITDIDTLKFGPTVKSDVDRLIDAMKELVGLITRGVGGALQGLAQTRVPTITIPWKYQQEGNAPSGLPEFARGTRGYQDFGAGTPVMLHGWEKVTPLGAPESGDRAVAAAMTQPTVINNYFQSVLSGIDGPSIQRLVASEEYTSSFKRVAKLNIGDMGTTIREVVS